MCVCSGSVSGGEEEEGPGVADFNGANQKLGGGWHQNPRPCSPHVPGHGPHAELSGTDMSCKHILRLRSDQKIITQDCWVQVTTKECVFVFQESNERYLVLFPHTLLVLSASLRMSGFIYQVSLQYIRSLHLVSLVHWCTRSVCLYREGCRCQGCWSPE